MSGAAPARERLVAQAAFEVRSLLRNGEQLLVSMVLPLLALVTLVMAAPQVMLSEYPDAAAADVAVPGVLGLAVVSTAFTGQAIALAYERRYGVLRLLGTTPLGRTGLMVSKAAAVLAVVALQTVVIGIVGAFLGWRPSVPGTLALVPVLLAGLAAFAAMGALVGGRLRAEAVLALANLLWVLFLGCGLLLPLSALPDGPAAAVALTPPGALGEGLRAATLGQPVVVAQAVGVLAAWAAVLGALAARALRWSD